MGGIFSVFMKVRNRKLFTEVFLIFLTSGILLCVLVLFSSYCRNVAAQEQANWDRYSTSLSYLVDRVDGELLDIHQSLSQVARLNSITNNLFKSRYDQNCVSNCMLDLSAFADNAVLIQKVFVYFRMSDYVITSSYVATPRQSSAYSTMVNEFDGGSISSYQFIDSNGGKTSKLFLYDGELYMSLDFPLTDEVALGTIFCQINKNSFFSSAQYTAAAYSRLFIYDSYCNPVFMSQLVYPNSIASLLPELLEEGVSQANVDGQDIAFACSNSFGWMFIYVIDAPAIEVSFWESLMGMGGTLVVFLACCVLMAWLLAVLTCKPFAELVSLAIPPQEVCSSGSAEIAWFLGQFKAQKNELNNLRHCVSEMSNDVFIRICRDLFSGQQKTVSEVSVVMNNTNLPFQIHALYQVCVFCVPSVANIQESGLIPILEEFCEHTKLLTQMIYTDTQTVAIVLSCTEKESILHIKKAVTVLKQQVASYISGSDLIFRFASGRAYHSLLDVGFSYQEALEQIRREPAGIVVPVSQQREPPVPKALPHLLEDYDQRAGWIISMLQKDGADNAEKLAARLIRTIFDSGLSREEINLNAQSLLSAFAGNISQLSNVSFSAFSTDFFVFDAASDNPEETLQSKCAAIIKALNSIFHKQNMPIILKTQQMVEENFADTNLSLSSVAEKVGVNMSYLSHQFKDSLGVTFTDYLNTFRVNKSLELLCSPDRDMTLNEVAVFCGFSSVQNYIRVFKKYIGMTPGQYRSDNAGNHHDGCRV